MDRLLGRSDRSYEPSDSSLWKLCDFWGNSSMMPHSAHFTVMRQTKRRRPPGTCARSLPDRRLSIAGLSFPRAC